jgi:6-pyruvoyl-tetrahydropterin synthase
MKKYKQKLKESIYLNNAGEELNFTIDFSNLENKKKFIDQLFKNIRINKKATNLTKSNNAKIIIPNNSDQIKAFKSVLIMNGFSEKNIQDIMKNVEKY